MILTRSHNSVPPLPSEPTVGAKSAARHIRKNPSRIRHFLKSLEPTFRDTTLELEFGDSPVSLSLVVENNRISLVPTLDVKEIVTDNYMFSCGLATDTKRADVCMAMANGALPFLASAQVQVRLVNKMSDPNHPATLVDLTTVMAAIDRDALAIVRIIQEQRGVAMTPAEGDLPPPFPKISIRTGGSSFELT